MASKKIHLLWKSAMEAGTPGDYYINPSEKLMAKASDWKAVEHEHHVETRTNIAVFDKNNPVVMKRYNNQAVDGPNQNEDDYFSYIVNSDVLNLKEIRSEVKDGIAICYYPKIKVEESKKKKNQNNKKNKKKNRNKKKN